jgi:glycosyltransferase involved in cell wall biosynthesis
LDRGPVRILYLEPFDGGSHHRFTRALTENIAAEWTVLTMPGRHWKWRMRGSASWLALVKKAELEREHDLLFASSFLPLAELIGLCPHLARIPKILYFHENQLAYPVRDEHSGERDTHFGFTQITSALAADACVFNSEWNKSSFLDEAERLLSRMPDAVPTRMIETIAAKSSVLGVPLLLPKISIEETREDRSLGPVILWNHRWEHDKGPEAFFAALESLAVPFRLIVCGERYTEAPPIFARAQDSLRSRILHFGFAETGYHELLARAHLAVSTAEHEFFGLSVLEAVHSGARPVVPDRLSYRELFPEEYRYRALAPELDRLCREWIAGAPLRGDRSPLTAPFGPPLLDRYRALFTSMRLAR